MLFKIKSLLGCVLMMTVIYSSAQKTKVTFETITEQCKGLDNNKRVRLSVSSFTVATPKASGQFGDELAEMLTNALQNVNCFNVLLSKKDLGEIDEEIGRAQTGSNALGASPQTGKMKGPQVIVQGKITEYGEGESSVGALGLKVGGNKAKIGFVIKLVNVETREIIDSKSINVEGKANGFQGFRVLGVQMAGSTRNNKAVADACEKGIIEAIEFIASTKDKMPFPEAGTGTGSMKFDASNCKMFSGAYIPKIMVILPEFHITRIIPDPAGETEINRKLVEAGFHVIDPSIYATLRNGAKFKEAAKDPAAAISLGKQYGADIIIFGEAFSQLVGNVNGQVSCRARTEVRAVKTADATIIATNGLEAGGMDLAEFVAAKTALRNAASITADYMLEQFCTKNISFAASNNSGATAGGISSNATEIVVKNTDYSGVKPLLDILTANGKVLEKNISNGNATISFEPKAKLDIAELIDSKLGSKFSIVNLADQQITLEAKK